MLLVILPHQSVSHYEYHVHPLEFSGETASHRDTHSRRMLKNAGTCILIVSSRDRIGHQKDLRPEIARPNSFYHSIPTNHRSPDIAKCPPQFHPCNAFH